MKNNLKKIIALNLSALLLGTLTVNTYSLAGLFGPNRNQQQEANEQLTRNTEYELETESEEETPQTLDLSPIEHFLRDNSALSRLGLDEMQALRRKVIDISRSFCGLGSFFRRGTITNLENRIREIREIREQSQDIIEIATREVNKVNSVLSVIRNISIDKPIEENLPNYLAAIFYTCDTHSRLSTLFARTTETLPFIEDSMSIDESLDAGLEFFQGDNAKVLEAAQEFVNRFEAVV